MSKSRDLGEFPAAALDIDASGNVNLTGDISLADNDKLILGTGSDLQIYHDGSHSYIADVGTGNLNLQGSSQVLIAGVNGTVGVQFIEGGGVNLRHNNAQKLATTSTGIAVTGEVSATQAEFSGSGIQLDNAAQIHTWTLDDNFNSRFNIGTSSAGANWNFGSNNNTYLKVSPAGIDVTGTVTADGLTVSDSQAVGVTASISNSNSTQTGGSRLDFQYGATVTGRIQNRFNGGEFQTDWYVGSDGLGVFTDVANTEQRLRVLSNGDISFYEDTGTTPKFFWDASVENLSLDSTGAYPLTISRNGGTDSNTSIRFKQLSSSWYAGTDGSNNFGIGTTADIGVAPFKITSGGNLYLSGDVITGGGGTGATGEIQFVADSTRARIVGGYNSGGGGYLAFRTDTSGGTDLERMRIDSAGNLTVTANGASAWATIIQNGTGTNAHGLYVNAPSSSGIPFRVDGGGSERMRLDSSGNLLVGTTTVPAAGNTTGFRVDESGYISLTGAGTSAIDANRMGSDGQIINLRKDGTTAGGIGVSASGTEVYLAGSGGNTSGIFCSNGNALLSMKAGVLANGTQDLGSPSYRFNDLHLAGSIQSSGGATKILGTTTVFSASNFSITTSAQTVVPRSAIPTLPTGVYLMTIYLSGGGWYSSSISGLVQHYNSTTNSSSAGGPNTIHLTAGGHAQNAGVLYARYQTTLGSDNQHGVQIWSSTAVAVNAITISWKRLS